MLATAVGMFARGRVRAEELHGPLLRMQRAHDVGHEFVGDMAIGIQNEAVVAETTALGGPAEQIRQVDAARRELLQNADEASGLIGALIHHKRRAIVSGWRRHKLLTDEHKTSLVGSVIGNVSRNHRKAIERGCIAWSNRGDTSHRVGRQRARRFGCAACWRNRGIGEIGAQVLMALSGSYRDREHLSDIGERSARRGQQAMLNIEHHFAFDEQLVVEGQGVLSEVDRAFDRILDGHETKIDITGLNSVEHIGNGTKGHEFAVGKIGLRAQCLLGKRAKGAQKTHPYPVAHRLRLRHHDAQARPKYHASHKISRPDWRWLWQHACRE